MTTLREAFGLVIVATAMAGVMTATASSAKASDRRDVRTEVRAKDPEEKRTPRSGVSDTVPSGEKSKPGRATPRLPASKKKAVKQPRIVFPGESQPQGRQAADQPWETTFLVTSPRYYDPSLRQASATYEP